MSVLQKTGSAAVNPGRPKEQMKCGSFLNAYNPIEFLLMTFADFAGAGQKLSNICYS
jgi:hypothetical protein